MKCRRCGTWIFEPSAGSSSRVAVTDPFLVQRRLVRPEDMKMTMSNVEKEGFVCPNCGWTYNIREIERYRKTIRMGDMLPDRKPGGET